MQSSSNKKYPPGHCDVYERYRNCHPVRVSINRRIRRSLGEDKIGIGVASVACLARLVLRTINIGVPSIRLPGRDLDYCSAPDNWRVLEQVTHTRRESRVLIRYRPRRLASPRRNRARIDVRELLDGMSDNRPKTIVHIVAKKRQLARLIDATAGPRSRHRCPNSLIRRTGPYC